MLKNLYLRHSTLGILCHLFLFIPNLSAKDGPNSHVKYFEKVNALAEASSTVTEERMRKGNDQLELTCFKDPSDPYFILVSQEQVIEADMGRISTILMDFSSYANWNMDWVASSGVEKPDGTFEVATEQSVPIPFVPNVKTLLSYKIERSKDSALFRYSMKTSSSLTLYEGFIRLIRLPNGRTLFREFDAVNADWGLAKAAGKDKIWKDSLEAMYQSDLALKLQAEDPKMPAKEALNKSRLEAAKMKFNTCIEHPTPI